MARHRAGRPPAVDPPAAGPRGAFGATAFCRGVERHRLEGVPVRVYSAAKTVVDCLRLRAAVGIDVALEALRDGLRRRTFTRDDVWRDAKAVEADALVRPYLEATTWLERGGGLVQSRTHPWRRARSRRY